MIRTVLLAVEDALSEAVATRLLSRHRVDVAQAIGLRGFGYLRSKAPSLNKTALGFPIFLLTDLDSLERCPAELIDTWLGGPRNPDLLFRVAVAEIESWVLADREAFARYCSIALARVPTNPDTIADPKQLVVNLFRRCKDVSMRRDVVPASGSTARVGPAYNVRLTDFVRTQWDPDVAAVTSPSLRRTVACIRRFVEAPR